VADVTKLRLQSYDIGGTGHGPCSFNSLPHGTATSLDYKESVGVANLEGVIPHEHPVLFVSSMREGCNATSPPSPAIAPPPV